MDKRIKNHPEAIQMYQDGLSVQDVADFYGVTRQAMWSWLKSRGVKFRSKIRNGQENHFYRGGANSRKRAHGIVEKAIKRGLMNRASTCEVCNKNCVPANGRPQIEAHHDDYNKPLNVRWMCRECHYQWHQTNTAIPFQG